MNFATYLKQIARGCADAQDLNEDEAYHLFSAVLDGGVPDLELGALLTALRMKSEALEELVGFHRALAERVGAIAPPPGKPGVIVIPSYGGARRQPNLLPLLALLLQRFGVPVLVHGTLEGFGRVTSAHIFRELGVMPSLSLDQAQESLHREHLAFVPAGVLCPNLQPLLALRARLGLRTSPHHLVKLIDPLTAGGIRMVGTSRPGYLEKYRRFLALTQAHAILLEGTEGEAFASPARRPRLEYFQQGEGAVLFEAESESARHQAGAPTDCSAAATAGWIRLALDGKIPLPLPLVNQIASCLYACGYTSDMNQAKAIAAVETGSLACN
ncbi:MAG: DNA-binding protein YbiB [Sulfuricellaceae bacterium]|jgi:anthranilate phosphoribosyltransferase